MRSIILVSLVSSLLVACSSEPDIVHLRTVKGQKKETVTVNANRMLTVEIEGMSCEMACGGTIRTNLKATQAVERVQFNFEEGRKIQTAFISYDSDKISDDEMLKLIRTINDKQFKTHKHSSEDIITKGEDPAESTKSDETSNVDVSNAAPSFELPNLFDLLNNLVR
jgi:mercuric ion binding protein